MMCRNVKTLVKTGNPPPHFPTSHPHSPPLKLVFAMEKLKFGGASKKYFLFWNEFNPFTGLESAVQRLLCKTELNNDNSYVYKTFSNIILLTQGHPMKLPANRSRTGKRKYLFTQ